MKPLFLFSLLTLSITTKAQVKDSIIEKWCKAVINLDCRPSKNLLPDNRVSEYKIGSAIFLYYKNNYYLVSARHVLEDKEEINRAYTKDPDPICYKIFVVERGDSLAGYSDPVMLMNLGSETSRRPYIFSSDEDDIAVVSLKYHTAFTEALLNKGYVPITLDDINVSCSIEPDQKIMAIGFSGDLFDNGRLANITLGQFASKSPLPSLPVVTEGTIGDIRPEKNTFVGNIFATKGNSGGPIISDNKLVGIVSRQITTFKRVSEREFGYYRSRELHFIKSSMILPLVERLNREHR